MNDNRELLELAAKAAGWTGWQSKHGYWNLTSPEGESSTHCHYWNAYCPDTGEKLRNPTFADAIAETNWNPLTDDGDALRLAVKLGIEFEFRDGAVWTEHRSESRPKWKLTYCEPHTGDALSATRRLIVRVAADIGKVRCASNP